ncbi:MAG TPA: class I SAM-dependent methyltransferase [Candidatus Nanoarchaeia archaeon]|nr:class I SAM-dependent methyltransferase [Candidatus Nanoarchaeia archaeon]
MQSLTLKENVQKHYDFVSPYYKSLWGNHIHHGYYETGKESKEQAQEKLILKLLEKLDLKKGSNVLDVGCGVGGTSLYLAEKFNCNVLGLTISPVQIEMARLLSKDIKNKPSFILADANNLHLSGMFDVIWAVEMTSHLEQRKLFFERCSKMLNLGGKICIAEWLKESNLSKEQENIYIKPIEEGMLVKLPTKEEYLNYIKENKLQLRYYDDISKNVAKTWDLCLDIIGKKDLWILAAKHGKEFISFLRSFQAMRKGFRSGNFRYALFVAEKSN